VPERATRWTEAKYFWETVVFGVAVLLFLRTVWYGWTFDDEVVIVANEHIRSVGNLGTIFTSTAWSGSGIETYLYRPLTIASFAVSYAIAGLSPWSWHLLNVLLHGVVSVLVYRLGRAWGLAASGAGLGALLFAVHPIHVGVVAGAVGRRDLLSAAFVLWMVLAHRRARFRGGWRSALPVVAFACALLTKEVGVAALGLVALHDWFGTPPEGRLHLLRERRLLVLYSAYLLTLAAYLGVRIEVAGGLGVLGTHPLDNPLVSASIGTRVLTAAAVIGKGLLLLAAPIRQSPDYSYDAIPLATSVFDWRVLSALAAVSAIAWLAFASRRTAPYVALGAWWYAVAVAPTSNLVFVIGTIFGERLLYLPSVAFCLVAGAALASLRVRVRGTGTAAAAIALIGLSALTVRYTAAWQSNLTLFEWAVQAVPNSTKAHHKLGEVYYRAGRTADAIRELERALAIAPGNVFAAQALAAIERGTVRP